MLSNGSRGLSLPVGGAGEWLSTWRFAGLLALVLGVTFWRLVTGVEALAYGDAGQFAYPVAFYHRETFWRGELPFWNAYSSCGIPFLAQWNTLALYPFSLFYLVLPVPWSFGVFCIGHMVLGGAGMFALARRWTGNGPAAAAAGLVFGFNGLTWYGLMWPHLLAALAWMPWVVLAMERAWLEGKRFIPLSALAAGMQLLTGGAEAILQTWIILAGLWLAHWFGGAAPRRALVFRAAGCALGAAGLAAAQLLPFVQLAAASQREAGFGGGGMAKIAAMPLKGAANFLVPLFHCVKNQNGVWMQAGQSWTASYYLGVGTVALGLVAAWRAREKRVRVLLGLAVFGMVMSLGSAGVVYDWVKAVFPPLGGMRFPVKFVMLPVFALPLLAAFGLKWLLELPPEKWRAERRRALLLAGGLAVFIAAIAVAAWRQPVAGADPAVAVWNAAARVAFLALAAGCVVLLKRTQAQWQRLLQAGLLAVLWLDVLTHAPNLSPTVPAAALEPDVIRQFFKWDQQLAPGRSRAMLSKDALWKMVSTGTTNLEHDVAARRLALSMNYNLLDHAAKMDGFYSMDVKQFLEVFQRAYFTTNDSAALQDFLGVSLVSAPGNAVDWVSRPTALPLITAGQKPVFAGPEGTLQRIFSKEFDPRRAVYLPSSVEGQIRAGPAACRIEKTRFSPQRIEAELEAAAPAMVVIAQTFYPCWQAYLDGKTVTLWRANHAFQAVEAPAGKHRLELAYEDRAFGWGTLVSGVSFLVCGVMWWRTGRD